MFVAVLVVLVGAAVDAVWLIREGLKKGDS